MTNDAEWLEDVRRWYYSGVRSAAAAASAAGEPTDLMALGYEAAHPALQAHHWPDAPATDFADVA
ncbi:MAG: hypothetical protein M3Y55_01080 [Pseudomonadota bacterium]|nr:hypothetical protein [Pseudomonadota bacterium]